MSVDWKPENFALTGVYCPKSTIAARLTELRQSSGAASSLLLIHSGPTVYRSLCLWDSSDARIAETLQHELANTRFSVAEGKLVESLRGRDTDISSSDHLLHYLPEALSRALRTVHPNDDFSIYCHESSFQALSQTRRFLVSWLIINIDAKRAVENCLTHNLDICINSSAQVVTEALNRQTDTIDGVFSYASVLLERKHLDPTTTHATHESASELEYSRLTDDISRLLESDLVGLYFRPGAGDILQCVGHTAPKHCNLRIEISKLDESPLGAAWNKQKLIVANDLVDSDDLARFKYHNSPPNAPILSVLVVPIVLRVFGTQQHELAGVLVCERNGTRYTHKPFSILDSVIARDAAVRLSLCKTRLERAASEVAIDALWDKADVVAALPSVDFVGQAIQVDNSIDAAVARNIADSKTDYVGRGEMNVRQSPRPIFAPPELWHDIDQLRRLLDGMRKPLGASFATIRLVSTDMASLIRVASSPDILPAEKDPHLRLPIRLAVLTADCVRSGEIILAERDPNSNSWKTMPGKTLGYTHPPTTRKSNSIICIPLVISSRVVGTVTFETPIHRGFRGSLALAHECGHIICRSLDVRQKLVQQRMMEMSGNLVRNVHDLKKVLAHLMEISSEARPTPSLPLKTTLAPSITLLNKIIYEPLLSPGPAGKDITIGDLVDQSILISKFATKRRRIGNKLAPSIRQRLVVARRREAVEHSLGELLENAFNATIGEIDATVTVAGREMIFGGQQFACISVLTSGRTLTREQELVLFRMPYSDEYGLHLGGFIAGTAIRAIGGECYIKRGTGTAVRMVLAIPIDD